MGEVQSALPRSIRFRDGTHATVAFVSGAAEIRGEVSLDEGDTRIVSTERLVLRGSPFHAEADPGVALRLVDGRRSEVVLDAGWALVGRDLTATRWRVASEQAPLPSPRAHEPGVRCESVHLWAQPRVQGPVLVTAPSTPWVSAPAPGAPGWNEVWLERGGVWLRGYAWETGHCTTHDTASGIGTMDGAAPQHPPETRALPAHAQLASAIGAPWTVRVSEAMRVLVARRAGHEVYVFPIDGGGSVLVEGRLIP